MQKIMTNRGKTITILSQCELRDPRMSGAYIRAFCPVHGSDHQRSLSIQKATGWGHCFNAACHATVLVEEWNLSVAAHLLHRDSQHIPYPPALHSPFLTERLPLALQPVLLHLPPTMEPWQQDELHTLLALDDQLSTMMLQARRAQAYLEGRGIPLATALETGVGYLSPECVPPFRQQEAHSLLRRWAARMIFPLHSPFGTGYIGRTLWRWKPGMDEQDHKALLEHTAGPRRWIKTNPAGWFCCEFDHLARNIIVVEGAFDRLALLAAGFLVTDVVALTGTAMQIEWLPPQVKSITLALDGDEGGQEATQRLADQLSREGFAVKICPPPQDRWGKDWNERWRRIGHESIWPLQETYFETRSA